MYATEPTLYGTTFPHRELPAMNPFLLQWQQQFPWTGYGRFFPQAMQPEILPQGQFEAPYPQPFYGNKLPTQLGYAPQVPPFAPQVPPFAPQVPISAYWQGYNFPYMQGYNLPHMQGYNLPHMKWPYPYAY